MKYFLIYITIISLIAIILTLHDKHAAIKHNYRISEKTLLTVSALGGSVAMLITMLAIHHKTKHPKFMIGIPAIIVLQIIVAVIALHKLNII